MINLSKKIEDDILEYCKLNEITDINNFIEKILRNGLNIEKYGNKPLLKSKNEVKVETKVENTEIKVEKPKEKNKPVVNYDEDDYNPRKK
jgi:hypothetical protein